LRNADILNIISDQKRKVFSILCVVVTVLVCIYGLAAILFHALAVNVFRKTDGKLAQTLSIVFGSIYYGALFTLVVALAVIALIYVFPMNTLFAQKSSSSNESKGSSNSKHSSSNSYTSTSITDNETESIRVSYKKHLMIYVIFSGLVVLLPQLRIELPVGVWDGVRIALSNAVYLGLYLWIAFLLYRQYRKEYQKIEPLLTGGSGHSSSSSSSAHDSHEPANYSKERYNKMYA